MNVRFAALSDPGRRRSENQDSVLAAGADSRFLLVVADGVGGLSDGASASQSTVRSLEQHFVASSPGSYTREDLVEDLQSANRAIVHTREQTQGRLSGTTAVALLLDTAAETFVVGHVGDSRAYLLRDARLEMLTEDHSLVAEQVRAGVLTAEEALSSSQRHVITRSLGIENDLEVELRAPAPIHVGDTFLLCSDGLTDVVRDEDLASILMARTSDPVDGIARSLIEVANERGGPDNISVVIARVEAELHG